MQLASVIKLVRSYDSTEWEIFIGEWKRGLSNYHEVKRLGAAGDHGRDVVGLCGSNGCEGVWDNFQCKHYDKPLPASKAYVDIGKIVFHSFRGVFAPPRRSVFVAPRGPSTTLRDQLLNPSQLKIKVAENWDKTIASNIEKNETHKLTGDLSSWLQAYDFSSFGYYTIDEVLDGHRKTAYWASRFGGILPAPPKGIVPENVAERETVYVSKLLKVYEQDTGQAIASAELLALSHPEHGADLWKQRVRFYDAEAFGAHYRDQTEPGTVEDFTDQIYQAVEPVLSIAGPARQRVSDTLQAATSTKTISVLEPQARPQVKQGVCHQLANDDRIDWVG